MGLRAQPYRELAPGQFRQVLGRRPTGWWWPIVVNARGLEAADPGSKRARRGFLAGHLLFGMLTTSKPHVALRVFGLDPDANRSAQWVFEAVGTRELVLGLVACGAAGQSARRAACGVLAASDAMLLSAYALGYRTSAVGRARLTLILTLGSASAVAGVIAARDTP